MVKVHIATTDHVTAWRVRDALAVHPLLGGAMAHIHVMASSYGIVLEGWVVDEPAVQLALKLACRAASQRPVHLRLCTDRKVVKSAEELHQSDLQKPTPSSYLR
jgi:hypothetical protein